MESYTYCQYCDPNLKICKGCNSKRCRAGYPTGENAIKGDTLTCRNPTGCNHRAVTFTSRYDTPHDKYPVCQMCYSLYTFLGQADRYQKGFDDPESRAAGLTIMALQRYHETAGTKWECADVRDILRMLQAHPTPRDFFINMSADESGIDFCDVFNEYQCGKAGGCGYHTRLWSIMLLLGDISDLPTKLASPGHWYTVGSF